MKVNRSIFVADLRRAVQACFGLLEGVIGICIGRAIRIGVLRP